MTPMTKVVKNLLIINILIFITSILLTNLNIVDNFALYPLNSELFRPYQFITYMFLHGSFLHIFFNMFTLWMFGPSVEEKIGTNRFISLYFIGGVFAAYFQQLINSSILIGASGAICAVMAAYAFIYPNVKLYLYFLFPVRAKYILGIFFLIELFSAIYGTSDGVGHYAHVGGAISGALIYLFHDKVRGTFIKSTQRKIDDESGEVTHGYFFGENINRAIKIFKRK